jgi:hypothetical protein
VDDDGVIFNKKEKNGGYALFGHPPEKQQKEYR